jgi:hypothetical protein
MSEANNFDGPGLWDWRAFGFRPENESVLQRSLMGRWIFGIANSQLGTVADKGNPTV